MRKQLGNPLGLTDGTWRIIDEVCSQCTPRQHFAAEQAVPARGARSSVHLNKHIGMDLLFIEALTILHIVDLRKHIHAPRFFPLAQPGWRWILFGTRGCFPAGHPGTLPWTRGRVFL